MESSNEEMKSHLPQKMKIFSLTNIILGLLLILIGLVHYLAWKNPDFGNNFSMTSMFAGGYTQAPLWLALGLTMLACFLGALIPMPVPYMIPVATFSAYWITLSPPKWISIILIIILAAIANTLGDMLDYIIGIGTEKALSKEKPELASKWSKLVLTKPKLIPYIIALFAVTPLPDSLLLVPLGIVEYPPKKTLVSMFIGKIAMMLITAIAGIVGIDFILNSIEEGGSYISGIILLYIMWVIIVFMVKFQPSDKTEEKNNNQS